MRFILLLSALLTVAACSTPVKVLKSPCAGTEGSPCGPKRAVNGWWLS